MPPSIFHRHPRPGAHHKNSLALFRPYVRTSHHRNFFTIDVVDKWNRIPEEVASALSPLSSNSNSKKLFMYITIHPSIFVSSVFVCVSFVSVLTFFFFWKALRIAKLVGLSCLFIQKNYQQYGKKKGSNVI